MQHTLAHRGNKVASLDNPYWASRVSGLRHCSYCGSLHPEDLHTLLKQGASLSAKPYHWPVVLYVTTKEGKSYPFRTVHLVEATLHLRTWVETVLGYQFDLDARPTIWRERGFNV